MDNDTLTNISTSTSNETSTSLFQQVFQGPFIPLSAPMKLNYGCIIIVGIAGLLANVLLIIALCYSKKDRKSTANILIVNQSVLDLTACAMLIVRFLIKLRSYYLQDWWGELLCKLEGNGYFQATFVYASTAGIVVISIERYFKIVHPIVHRNYGRNWMILSGVPVSWLFGFIMGYPSTFATAQVMYETCIQVLLGETLALQRAFAMFLCIAVFLGPVGIMAFCYASILGAIRSSVKVAQANQLNGAIRDATRTSRISSKEINIVATMITQAVCFFAFNAPTAAFYTVFGMTGLSLVPYLTLSYVLQFIGYLNVCSNPLVYALKYRRVHATARRVLAALKGHRPQQNASLQSAAATIIGPVDIAPNTDL